MATGFHEVGMGESKILWELCFAHNGKDCSIWVENVTVDAVYEPRELNVGPD